MSIKSIIINHNTFRNVDYNQEKIYLEKTLNTFKLSYPNDETIIIYEKLLDKDGNNSLKDVEDTLFQFGQSHNMKIVII